MDEHIRKELTDNLTVSVQTAGKALRIGKNEAYKACQNGQIPSVRILGRIRVPTAPLLKMLGIGEQASV